MAPMRIFTNLYLSTIGIQLVGLTLGLTLLSILGFLIINMLFLLFYWSTRRIWLLRLICWRSSDKTPVELIDISGDQFNTIAVRAPDGVVRARVYWFNNVGSVILHSDGTVDIKSESSYIRWWKPLRPAERVEHVLRYDSVDVAQLKAADNMQRIWK